MSFLHQRESRVSSASRESHISHAENRRLKYVDLLSGFIEKARIAEKLILSGIHSRRAGFSPKQASGFSKSLFNPASLSVIFLLLQKHYEILMLCLMEYHDDGVSLRLNETGSFQIFGGD